jgi:hypothetical protein
LRISGIWYRPGGRHGAYLKKQKLNERESSLSKGHPGVSGRAAVYHDVCVGV